MSRLDARTLWWHDARECTCPAPDEDWPCDCEPNEGWYYPLFHVAVASTPFITDRFVAFPAHLLENAPPAGALLTMDPDGPASKLLAQWMSTPFIPHVSERRFRAEILDPIEAAGLRVRPLDGVKAQKGQHGDTHGVCDPEMNWRVIGLVAPIKAGADDIPGRVAL
jgi:hypothetical protein